MDSRPEKQACDVFVSHRGTLKRGLISLVVQRLQRANLDVFVDYEMSKGVETWALILAKLRGAHRILLFLSPGFEESPWCLEEARIAAERRNAVLPVFFDRMPSEVDAALLQRAWHELRLELPSAPANTPELWRDALRHISNISGWEHRSGTEYDSLPYLIGHSKALINISVLARTRERDKVLRRAVSSAALRRSLWTRCRRTCCAYSGRWRVCQLRAKWGLTLA